MAGGARQTVVMASTPSDRRAGKNTLARINRLNRDDAADPAPQAGAPSRRPRKKRR